MMRYLMLLLFCCLFNQLKAQINLTTEIALADTYCTDPTDPNNCFNIPAGNDNLAYFPGVDGDYLVTYKVENTSAIDITQLSISDTRHGLVLPSTTINIPGGQTYFLTMRFDSVFQPELDIITATVIAQTATGVSTEEQSDYTLDILGPEVETTFSIVRKVDACPENVIAPECTTTDYGAITLNIGAGDTIVTRFNWKNVGLTTYDLSTLTDQDGGVLANTGFNQVPGQELISANYLTVPDEPGTYPLSQKITITDMGGNMTTSTINYTVIVEAPKFEVEFGVARQDDVCPNIIAASCNVPYGINAVTVGAADTLTTRFQWTNIGLGTWDIENIVDQDDFQVANTGFDQMPGQTLISARHWVAPDISGTYNWSQTLTITDKGGNVKDTTVHFVVIVEAPKFEVEFGVARQDDVCPNIIAASCNVPYGINAVTVGAADTLTTRFQWTNTGLGTWDLENIVDQDDFQVANTGFDQIPGQTLISARHWVAPDAPGIYDWSQTLTITDLGGNIKDTTIHFVVTVEAPQFAVEFGVVRQDDVCPNTSASNCNVPYGVNAVTVGAADILTTRFQRTNTGLGTWDIQNIVDQDNFQFENTGIDQVPGQTFISTRHWVAPDAPGTYNWSQTLTITDQGGNMKDTTIEYTVTVDCSVIDKAPPIAICKDTTIIIFPGQTVTLNPIKLNDGSFDQCGMVVGGSLDKTTFTCSDVGVNEVTLTVEDDSGNISTCISKVTVLLDPSIPFTAGADQEVCVTQVQLGATVPPQGMGMWSIVSGTGGMIGQQLNPTSMFQGISGETYTLRWTHQNNSGSCVFSDDVVITMSAFPSTADAGIDQTICGNGTALMAVDPGIGSGSWSVISGTGAFITDSTLYNTSFEGDEGQVYELEWEVSNGTCAVSKDTVQITFSEAPSIADAGDDKITCATLIALAAQAPLVGVGEWTIIEGMGGSFLDANQPITDFTGTQGETYKLEWSITNGSCIASRDTIQITIFDDPSPALAGSDQVVSGDVTTLAGNTPAIGVGSWSITSGVGGSIVDISSPTSSFSGLLGETYELEWKVSSGSCAATTDDVSITLEALPPSTASAGDDIVSCATTIMLDANIPAIGTGEWTIVDGAGGSITSTSSSSSSFSGAVGETYTLQWRIENDGLFSADQVKIRIADTNELINDSYVAEWADVSVFAGSNILTVDANLSSDFDKVFKAGTEVEFLEGTELEAGAQLEIVIEGCGD